MAITFSVHRLSFRLTGRWCLQQCSRLARHCSLKGLSFGLTGRGCLQRCSSMAAMHKHSNDKGHDAAAKVCHCDNLLLLHAHETGTERRWRDGAWRSGAGEGGERISLNEYIHSERNKQKGNQYTPKRKEPSMYKFVLFLFCFILFSIHSIPEVCS